MEEARTNYLTYSEQFDNGAWSKSNATISANLVTAPNGATAADKLVESTANTQHLVTEYLTITAGTALTASIFLKSAERTSMYVGLSGASLFPSSLNPYLIVNTSSCSITSSINVSNSSIQNVGNGWCRVTLTQTPTSSGGSGLDILLMSGGSSSYLGDGSSGAYVWGAQVEIGNSATSYIPTTSVAVSRVKDLATASTSSWYSATAGSIFSSVKNLNPLTNGAGTNAAVCALNDGSGTNRIDIRYNQSGGGGKAYLSGPGGGTSITYGATTAQTQYNFALSYDATTLSYSRNGSTTQTASTASSLPGALATQLQIGSFDSGAYQPNGWIKDFKYHNTKLPDADLSRLSP